MTLNEAKTFLNENGYELIDEGFFGKNYLKYKKKVINELKKTGKNIWQNIGKIESWIRDYFLDKMDWNDCVLAIRDNILK